MAGLARPVLRAGLHVVRRDDGTSRSASTRPTGSSCADRPGLCAALTTWTAAHAAELRPVLDRLVADGWVVDARRRAAAPAARAGRRPPVDAATRPSLPDRVVRACAAAGLPPPDGRPHPLFVTLGEPRRSVSTGSSATTSPTSGSPCCRTPVRIGPFVDPGRTACLRCVDAHLGDVDPRRAPCSTSWRTCRRPRSAIRIPAWCSSRWPGRCATSSGCSTAPGRPSGQRRVTVTEDLDVSRRDWLRHPHCGCAWG